MHNTNKNTEIDLDKYGFIFKNFSVEDLITTENPLKKAFKITNIEYTKENSSGSKAKVYKFLENGRENKVLLYEKTKEFNTKGGEKINVFNQAGFYNNNYISGDKGDIFQFIKNRTPNKTAKEVFSLLNEHQFFTDVSKWKQIKADVAYKKSTNKKNNIKSKEFNISDYKNLRIATLEEADKEKGFFKKRGIMPSLLEDSAFKGVVYLYEYSQDYQNKQITQTYAFFPKYKDENIVGAEVKSLNKQGYSFGDYDIFWRSNKPEKVEKIVIVESAINALSHKQHNLEKNDNTWYFSLNGNLSEKALEEFFSFLEKENIDLYSSPITLATDNDFDGVKYDFDFLNQIMANGFKFCLNDSCKGKMALSVECSKYNNSKEISGLKIKISKVFSGLSEKFSKDGFGFDSDENKVYLTYTNKEYFKTKPLFVKDLMEKLSFLGELPMNFEKSPRWSDWNDISQYDFDRNQYSNLQNIMSVLSSSNEHFLKKYGLGTEEDGDVIENESFRNRIYVFHHKDENGKVTEALYSPKLKGDYECGAEIDVNGKITHANNNKKLLWFSNKPKKIDNVVVVETVKDAMSHKKLDLLSNKNTWYCSIGKRYTKEVRDELFKELNNSKVDLKNTKFKIELNNSLDAVNFELLCVNKYMNDSAFWVKYNSPFDTTDKDYAVICFSSQNKSNTESTKALFNKIMLTLNKQYLLNSDNSMIKLSEKENTVYLSFPSSNKLKRVSSDIVSCIIRNSPFINNSSLILKKRKNASTINNELKRYLGIKITENKSIEKKKYRHKIKT